MQVAADGGFLQLEYSLDEDDKNAAVCLHFVNRDGQRVDPDLNRFDLEKTTTQLADAVCCAGSSH